MIAFDGEPGEVSGLEPSKSQSDTLKVRLKIPLPCAIDRASIAIGPFSEHVNADAVKKCRVYEKKSLASNGVSAGMYIEKSTQSGLLKIYKVRRVGAFLISWRLVCVFWFVGVGGSGYYCIVAPRSFIQYPGNEESEHQH